jgi:hypothetical protein
MGFRAELRSLYPVSAVTEPGGGVVGGDGFESLGHGLIEGFFRSCFGVAFPALDEKV